MSTHVVNVQEVPSKHSCWTNVAACKSFVDIFQHPVLTCLSFYFSVFEGALQERSYCSCGYASKQYSPLDSESQRNVRLHRIALAVTSECKLIDSELCASEDDTAYKWRHPSFVETTESFAHPNLTHAVDVAMPILFASHVTSLSLHLCLYCIEWMPHDSVWTTEQTTCEALDGCFSLPSWSFIFVSLHYFKF